MDITTIIEIIVALVAALITYVLIPYIKSRTTAAEQERINALAKTAVLAAEQLITGSNMGAERKAYVLEWLKGYNVKLDTDKLNALVEAAVYEMKKGVL